MTRPACVVLIVAATVGLTATGCRSRTADTPAAADPNVRTIQQSTNLPTLPLPTETASSASASTASLVDLPFTPAISMDPVDGGKVSITPETPVAEFKDLLYYFRTEENRLAFESNPDKYTRGTLSRY